MKKRTYGHTKSGKPIDDELIEKLADDAEQGYDVDEIVAHRGKRGRPRLGSAPSTVESVRLDPDSRNASLAGPRMKESPSSEVIREALRHHLEARPDRHLAPSAHLPRVWQLLPHRCLRVVPTAAIRSLPDDAAATSGSRRQEAGVRSTMAVTVLRPRARHVGQLPKRCSSAVGDADHVVADLDLLGRSLGAQADDDERCADLALGVSAVLLHGGGCGRDVGIGVTHDSSRREAASLSRIAKSIGTRTRDLVPRLRLVEVSEGHPEELQRFDPFQLQVDHRSESNRSRSRTDHSDRDVDSRPACSCRETVRVPISYPPDPPLAGPRVVLRPFHVGDAAAMPSPAKIRIFVDSP